MDIKIDFIIQDIEKLQFKSNIVDTIIMNPPFGTRNKGIDLLFLQKAIKVC